MTGPFVKSSFDSLLKLYEVMWFRRHVTISADT